LLLKPDGELIGEKIFSIADPAAESSYNVPEGFQGALWATSFCNLHDLWLTEFTV
jgi:superoxide reductase